MSAEPVSMRKLKSCGGVPTWTVAMYPTSFASMSSPRLLLAVGAFAAVSPPFVCASRSISGKPSAVDEDPDALAAVPVEVALLEAAPVSVELLLLEAAPVSVELLEATPVAVESLAVELALPPFLSLPFDFFLLVLPVSSLVELVSVELPVATPVSVVVLLPSSADEAAADELLAASLS